MHEMQKLLNECNDIQSRRLFKFPRNSINAWRTLAATSKNLMAVKWMAELKLSLSISNPPSYRPMAIPVCVAPLPGEGGVGHGGVSKPQFTFATLSGQPT